MGRSQGVVFGYGSVIPISDFVKVFPGSFIENGEGWSEGNINRLRTKILNFVYTDNRNEVFVTTQTAADYCFEKGYIWGSPDLIIDMTNILAPVPELLLFLNEKFPNHGHALRMFAYELD